MKTLKVILAICCVAAIGAGISFLNADPWNKKTVITIKESMQIPGAVLTPGTYVFKLAGELSANRNVVQVLNKEETQVISTILAIPNRRLQPTGKSEFGFWEVPAGSIPAMRSWFYPGDNSGHEFAYPKQEATRLSEVVKQEVPAVPQESTQFAPSKPAAAAPVLQPAAPAPEPQIAQATPPPAAPAAVEEPPTPAKHPATASAIPLVGLLGLFFAALGVALRASRAHLS